MEIRELTGDDRAAVTGLWQEAGLTRPWNEPNRDFERALVGPTSTVLGALDAGGLAGVVMVGYDGRRGWVYYLAVERAKRGRGVGRRLMQEAESWLRQRDVVTLNLMVRHSNAAALSFYQRLGYEDAPVDVLARWLVEPRIDALP